MRIIKERKESEKIVECDRCYATIGYYPSEARAKYAPGVIGRHLVTRAHYMYDYIVCPCCGADIIIRDNNGED